MNAILSTAIVITTLTSLFLVVRYRNMRLSGETPIPLVTFMAILFTSGLDVGLIMFCLLYTSPSPRDKRQSRMPSTA